MEKNQSRQGVQDSWAQEGAATLKVVRKGLPHQRPERTERKSHLVIWGTISQSKGKSKCDSLEVGECLTCSRKRKPRGWEERMGHTKQNSETWQ
jgi:hypothetical protein